MALIIAHRVELIGMALPAIAGAASPSSAAVSVAKFVGIVKCPK